ncbi:hypothetical protein [Streptomyces sp. NBC_00704]|uniref:hypothetical protein n=1 Tax=Streptomyces sp. NBC_00704 TaxID=2975809 RepID=UPI003FA68226
MGMADRARSWPVLRQLTTRPDHHRDRPEGVLADRRLPLGRRPGPRPGPASPLREHAPRVQADLLALLAGFACTRFGVFAAGVASAEDPTYTVEPQRRRRNARAAQDA